MSEDNFSEFGLSFHCEFWSLDSASLWGFPSKHIYLPAEPFLLLKKFWVEIEERNKEVSLGLTQMIKLCL